MRSSGRRSCGLFLAGGLTLCLFLGSVGAQPVHRVFEPGKAGNGAAGLQILPGALANALKEPGKFRVERFPLGDGTAVDLEVERFRLVAPGARLVVGDGENERPLDFAPESIAFFRGEVPGFAGSHVFLSISDRATLGRIELGPGHPTFAISSTDAQGAGRALVHQQRGGTDGAAPPLVCPQPGPGDQGDHQRGPAPELGGPAGRMRQAQLAVDGDYPLFLIMGSSIEATTEYMMQVYAQASDIMMRDLNVRLDIVFLRVFDVPGIYGFNGGHPRIPPNVTFDLAQLLSGTRDVGAGGEAFVCASSSWAGFALGQFRDPATSNIFNQDIIIAAHEMAHCLGSLHPHDYNIDDCDNPLGPTRRGSILSYCYYYSGGYANTDMRFHTGEQQRIVQCLAGRPNFVFDCNANGISDALDISSGFSRDTNVNAIPDECEDCNANGVLDPQDIASGASTDLDANGRPDECQPDCNANHVPDRLDISRGTSTDLYGNGVPDECEADCNGNGASDYTDIQADMSLDIDRNAVLDSCQDCDADGVPDLTEIDGANNLWVISTTEGLIREYFQNTGVLVRTSPPGHLSDPQDLVITPTRRILVSSAGDHRVVEFDHTGAFARTLIEPGGPGKLMNPGAMLLTGDGGLLVASAGTNSVLRYSSETGGFEQVVVASGSGGLTQPYGLAFGPGNSLLVTSSTHEIFEFDRTSGAFVRVLVPASANGGLSGPRDLVLLADGRIVVASEFTDRLLAFNASTGASLGRFNYGAFNTGLDGAWGLALGPDGLLYASGANRARFHLTDPRVIAYDPSNGYLQRTFVQRPDSQLRGPRGLDFMPGAGLDCNHNGVPDSCDISAGRSDDLNGNAVPDECEACGADFNADRRVDTRDFFDFLVAFFDGQETADFNDDGAVNSTDFFEYLTAFFASC